MATFFIVITISGSALLIVGALMVIAGQLKQMNNAYFELLKHLRGGE